MDATQGTYTPRAGSKASKALEQLAHGPATDAQLALAMDCDVGNVMALLNGAKQAGLIIRVTNEAGVLHSALASAELPAGFSRQVRAVDPADPFGLVAKRGATGDTADAANDQRRKLSIVPASPDDFVAALFSTGELMLQVGDEQLFLNRDHQRKLQHFCTRFDFGAE